MRLGQLEVAQVVPETARGPVPVHEVDRSIVTLLLQFHQPLLVVVEDFVGCLLSELEILLLDASCHVNQLVDSSTVQRLRLNQQPSMRQRA
jgi:hypothetical protein